MTPMIALIWDGTPDGQLHKSSTLMLFPFFYNTLCLICRLTRVGLSINEDVRQFLYSQGPNFFKHLPEYAQEAVIRLCWSHIIDHHQLLKLQSVADNLWTFLILKTRSVLTVERVGLQLSALEDSVHDLQRSADVLARERDQAMEVAAKA